MSRLDTSYLTLTIAPTTACNFKCVYCYESGITPLSAKAQTNLLEDTISFVKLFKNTKYLRVTWYGGEPLLQFEYIEKMSHRLLEMFDNYNARMITNAYLLDKAKSQKLKELKISTIQVMMTSSFSSCTSFSHAKTASMPKNCTASSFFAVCFAFAGMKFIVSVDRKSVV